METVEVTIAVPKESKEILDVGIGITKDLLQGKGLEGVVARFPQVLEAVNGYEKVIDEVKGAQNDELLGYAVQQLTSALKGDA